MSSDSRAIVPHQHGVVAAVGNQIAITEKLLTNSMDVVLVPQPPGETTHYIALSPDGRHVISGGDYCLSLWDVATGYCLWSVGVSGDITCVAFSPDGKHALSSSLDADMVQLWDAFTGKCVWTFEGRLGSFSVVFSPDGRHVLASASICILLFDVQTGTCLREFNHHFMGISNVAFSPDGRFALSDDQSKNLIGLWDVASGCLLRAFKGHSDRITSVAFSPDGCLGFSTSIDGTLRIWEIESGVCRQVIYASPRDSFNSITINPDGRNALLSSWDHLRLLDIETFEHVTNFVGHNSGIYSVAISPNGRLALSGCYDATMRLWDIASGDCLRVFSGHSISYSSIAFTRDRKRALVADSDNNLRLLDVARGECRSVDVGDVVFVSSFTLAPNAHLAISIANNGTLSFLSTVTGECIRKIEGFASLSNLFSSQTNIAISSNGELALWGSESKVILLDIATGNIIQEYVGHTDNVTFVAFFPNDDFVLSVSKDNTINVWDIYYGYCTFTFYDENCSCISSVFVGPDNILISVGDQGNLYFWDWATEKCLSKHEMHSAKITSLAFSTDERLFLTGSDDCTCCLWDITTYECLQIFKGHSGPIRDVGFLSNDRVVVSAGHDGIRYWERETGKELARSYIFDDNSWAIIAPDGSYDSSDNGASKHLRWTAGLISYPVTRFKSRYYTPGLLSNILGLETLDDIRKDLGDCHRCNLGDTRTNLVFGAGNPKARLVFVGEAPSGDEDRQGLPFVGEAGQLLTKIIKAMGFNQDEVYICNVLKCRPPRNRYPEPDEVKLCYPFLHRQIEAINPDVIFALGPIAAQTLLRTKESITRLRGVFQDYHGIPLMPTFPPVYLLRYASMKRGVWEDMKKVMKLLGKVPPEIGRAGSSG